VTPVFANQGTKTTKTRKIQLRSKLVWFIGQVWNACVVVRTTHNYGSVYIQQHMTNGSHNAQEAGLLSRPQIRARRSVNSRMSRRAILELLEITL
jgi:hypothetical protein